MVPCPPTTEGVIAQSFEPIGVKVAVIVPGPFIVAVVEVKPAFVIVIVPVLDHAVNV